MSKKKKSKKTNFKNVQKVLEQQQPEKNNTLIFGGILIAISSIGLLFFVLSYKVFNLS
jgi:maltodextrin utilization protein YvdJ